MKNILLIGLIAVVVNIAAFGQKPVAHKPVVKKSASVEFVREKFDPKRDPKADLSGALALASKSGKRVILDVGGEWCHWCVHMDKFIAAHAALSKLRDDNFVWLKVNFSEENENPAFLAPYP